MPTQTHSESMRRFATFGVPILAVGFAYLLKLSMAPLVGSQSPTLLFLAAVVASAWYGGLISGLCATVLSTLVISVFFLPPYNRLSVNSHDVALVAIFCFEGIFVSVLGAARYRIVERLHQRERQQAAVAELSQLALSNPDLRDLMNSAVALVARLLNVQYCNIIKSMPDKQLLLYAGVGCREGSVGVLTFGHDSQAGYTLQSRGPVIFDNLPQETRFQSAILMEHGVVSGISVIIHNARDTQGEEPFGIIGAHATHAAHFTQDDVNFLQTIADVLGAAIDRKRAEEALAGSEAQNRIFLAAVPDLMFRLDRSGALLELLSQQSWDVALSAEQFSGRNIADLVPPEYSEQALQAIERALKLDTVQVFEYQHSVADRMQFFEARLAASSGDEVIAIVRDISEQKAAEAERDQLLIREREARERAEATTGRIARLQTASVALAGALTPVQVAEVAVAEAKTAMGAHAAHLTMLVDEGKSLKMLTWSGFQAEDIQNWQQISMDYKCPPTDAVRTEQMVLVSNYEGLRRQYPEHAANSTIPFATRLSVPLQVEDRAIGALTIAFADERNIDASDQAFIQVLARQCARALDHARLYDAERLARNAAEEAQLRLEFLAEASAQLSSSLDYRTTVAKVTSLAVPHLADWCAVYIQDEEGLVQQVSIAHVNPEKIAWEQEIIRLYPPRKGEVNGAVKVIRSGKSDLMVEVPDSELRLAAHDERHYQLIKEVGILSAMIVPLLVRGKAVGALSFVSTNESMRRYSTTDLSLAEDLARRVATAIDNAQLFQQAFDANRIKDDFLATLSHELRTPLNAILGWTHLLQSGQLDVATSEHALGSIERSAKSQAQLINDLLDVSRIISGKLSLEHAPVELRRLVSDAVAVMMPVAELKSVRLRTTINIETDVVTGDAMRLQQIVWNLLSNAIKFTPEFGEVEVRLEQTDDSARIVVRDTGAGISPEFLPHVFDRFRQADSTSTRRHGGLGLGLSIVRHLVDMHGGNISADSEGEGKGSAFTIELPLAHVADDLIQSAMNGHITPPEPVDSRPPRLREPAPMLAGLKILLVDDENDTRDMLSLLLSQHGAEIRSAESASAALDTIENWTPDALISDIGMPETDGYMLLARVRDLDAKHGTNIPALAVTAYASEEDRGRALAAGFQMYLAKPIQPEELATAVARLAKSASLNS